MSHSQTSSNEFDDADSGDYVELIFQAEKLDARGVGIDAEEFHTNEIMDFIENMTSNLFFLRNNIFATDECFKKLYDAMDRIIKNTNIIKEINEFIATGNLHSKDLQTKKMIISKLNVEIMTDFPIIKTHISDFSLAKFKRFYQSIIEVKSQLATVDPTLEFEQVPREKQLEIYSNLNETTQKFVYMTYKLEYLNQTYRHIAENIIPVAQKKDPAEKISFFKRIFQREKPKPFKNKVHPAPRPGRNNEEK